MNSGKLTAARLVCSLQALNHELSACLEVQKTAGCVIVHRDVCGSFRLNGDDVEDSPLAESLFF